MKTVFKGPAKITIGPTGKFQVTVGHHDLAIYHKHKYYRQTFAY